jgi:flavin reductase (DIM6/NTAB) family NADH-FMN oxidoreductase RutF
MIPESNGDTIAQALGRIPSGIYILTLTGPSGRSTGMLASWVQQAGFDPPMITVAVRKDRYVAEWMAETGHFTLNQVGTGQKPLLKHFGRGFGPDDPAFEGVATRATRDGAIILIEAISYLTAEVVGAIDGGDHRVFLARVVEGERQDDGEPMIHLRKTGLHY